MKLSIKDKRLLYELDKNSRSTLTELAKKLKTSKEVIHYRLNQLIKNKVILKFHTVPASYRFGLASYKVYLRLHDLNENNFKKLIHYLKNNSDVFWIGLTKGRWDLIFGIWAKSLEEFYIVHDIVIDKFGKYIQEKQLSISRENLQYNRRWLYNEKENPTEFNFGEKEEQVALDAENKRILKVLTSNSREKIIDIAKLTNLSVDSVSYRIKKMKKENIIRGYKTLLNASKLNFTTCKALIYFKNITKEKKALFISYCKFLPNTINIVTTFAPWDIEIMFETESYESYFKIMDKIKEEFNDIVKLYDSVLITEEPKQVFNK